MEKFNKLIRLRKEARLTQAGAAKLLGMSERKYASIELGERKCTPHEKAVFIEKMSIVLNASSEAMRNIKNRLQ